MATTDEMDLAAKLAEDELDTYKDDDIALVASWFANHFMKAGHKRLGRILVAKNREISKRQADTV